MTTLRLLLHETWPERSEARWALLDAQGRLVGEGAGEPRQWPAADRTEAVLTGAQLSWHCVPVPRASVREQAKALPFALEELLVREPDSQHPTPTEQGEERWCVLVIARERLRRVVAQFATIQRPLDRVFAALQTVPASPDQWVVALEQGVVCVRSGQQSGFADDSLSATEPPMLLAAALEQARETSALPAGLRVLGGDAEVAAWQQALALAVEHGGEWRWWAVEDQAADLLHGEFAPRHRQGSLARLIKPAVVLAVLALVIDLGLGVGQALLQRSRLNAVKNDMRTLLARQMPNTPALNPPLQMRRELNTHRARQGLLADDDALSLMSELAVALGTESSNALQLMRYEGGTLDVSFAPGSAVDSAALVQRLSSRKVRAVARETTPLRLVLRRAEP